MKLKIEVELSPDEFGVATEVLTVLSKLTPNFSVRTLAQTPAQGFRAAIAKLEEPTALDSASAEINAILANTKDPTINAEFFEAFMDITFAPSEKSVVPYFSVLPRLPSGLQVFIRENMIRKLLNFLVVNRPVDCNRREFFSYAEAFAALLKLEFADITGAIATITALVQNPNTRCAAITMLGKTVELCLHLLTEKCDPLKLNDLRSVLSQVTEEALQYDLNYIYQNLGWTSPAKSPALDTSSKPPPNVKQVLPNKNISGPPGVLVATTSFTGHTDTLFAIAYDEARDQVIGTGKDGVLISWTAKDGKQIQKMNMPRHYACAMDINAVQKFMLICGVSKEGKEPALISYAMNNKGLWDHRGNIEREDVKLISCVKALVPDSSGNNIFVSGESVKSSTGQNQVRVYDVNSSTSFSKLQPLVTYTEHEDMVTCLTSSTNSEGIFFSGARDYTIRMWDRRQKKAVGMLGVYQPATGKVTAHDSLITCLDSYDNVVVSGGLDKKVLLWDLRSIGHLGYAQLCGKISVGDDAAVLKVVMGPTNSNVAVATLKGLWMADFGGSAPKQAIFKDKKPGRYHDLKWNTNKTVLYAGGDDMRVDQYVLKPSA